MKRTMIIEIGKNLRLRLPVAEAGAAGADTVVPAGLYSGVLADGSGAFWLTLDEPVDGFPRMSYFCIVSENGSLESECMVEELCGILILKTDDGAVYAVDLLAGTAVIWGF